MNIWEELQKYTKTFTGISEKKLFHYSKIEKDLGVTGDDALDYIEEFIVTFAVDVEGFDFSKYIGKEGFDPLCISILIRKILKKPQQPKGVYDLTLRHLELWATHGSWIQVQNEIET